jgi:dTDP-4-dehydrorhamnose reductase
MMKTISNSLKSSLLSIILAILIMAAGYFSLKELGRYVAVMKKLENQEIRLQLVRSQLQQSNRIRKVIDRIQRFLNRAKTLGLTEKKWATYNVSVEEPVTYDEFQQILDQCNHTALFYFNPIRLHISRSSGTESDAPPRPRTPGAGSAEQKNGDLLINLKGAFVIRETP